MSSNWFNILEIDRLGEDFNLPGVLVGKDYKLGKGEALDVYTPIDGRTIARVICVSPEEVDAVVERSRVAFEKWRLVPPPQRGELVRRIGDELRSAKISLAHLITLETGKITQESLGEVQEMIDICDFAVGLSRQLYGLTIATERPDHRLMEQWLPLGPVGVISAFNFPVAVWAWNAMLALVCGDTLIWKPSEKTPVCAMACHLIVLKVLNGMPEIPKDILSVLVGGKEVGQKIAAHPRLPLISATGSVPMGRKVSQTVGSRLGRCLLELGGNNGMIVMPSADLELALRSILFSAVGTCGQRCTTLRRLFVHEAVADVLLDRVLNAFSSIMVGDPRRAEVLVGPLVDELSFVSMQNALNAARETGGIIHGGERVTEGVPEKGYYVRPAVVEISADAAILKEETFAPILYVIRCSSLEEALGWHNDVPQGLASSIFTKDICEAERFLSSAGSDCGIANVNIGPSGAEIGGAFGGEKDTGGGRESGSDAWKNYMRRQTATINYGKELPLAQGIRFG